MTPSQRAFLSGALAVLLASPAVASPLTYAIGGTVIAGQDRAGLFGGGDLAGDEFSAVFTLHPADAAWTYGSPHESGGNGGSHVNGRSFADVILTIGSASTRFADYTSNLSAVGGKQFNIFVQSSDGADKNDIGFYVASPRIRADYTQATAIQSLSDTYAGYYTLNDAAGQQVDWANFEVKSLVAVNAVPLPAAAPMFGAALLGLAAFGYSRKRRQAAARL